MTEEKRVAIHELIKLKVADLKFDQTNPNVMNEEQMEALRKSFKTFGYLAPIIVDQDYNLVDGEHRALIYKEFGYQEIPGYKINLKTDADRRLLRQVMNKLHGEHDKKKDADELKFLFESQKLDDLAQLIAKPKEEFQNALERYHGMNFIVEENFDVDKEIDQRLQAPAITKRGDVWQLGPHRLMCGDSTSREDVEYLHDGKKTRLVISSPPYLNQREYSQFSNLDEYNKFIEKVVDNFNLDVPGAICWNIGSAETDNAFLPAYQYFTFEKAGYEWQEWIVWNKDSPNWGIPRSMHIQKGMYFPALRWESILVFINEKHPSFDESDIDKIRGYQENVWNITRVNGGEQKKTGHPAMFPLELPRRCIIAYSKKGDLVYEPFGGSGSTIVASEQTGRVCYAMELQPQYCDVIVNRWEALTGNKATLIKQEQRISTN